MNILPMDSKLNWDNPQHRHLGRLILAYDDIGRAAASAEHIRDTINNDRHPLFKPLMYATVICYARPFVRTKQYPGIPERYADFEDSRLLECHNALIDYRNEYVAHNDLKQRAIAIIPKGAIVAIGNEKHTTSTHGHYISGQTIDLATYPWIIKLCTFQRKRINQEIQAAINSQTE
jgi:hypothetical protein